MKSALPLSLNLALGNPHPHLLSDASKLTTPHPQDLRNNTHSPSRQNRRRFQCVTQNITAQRYYRRSATITTRPRTSRFAAEMAAKNSNQTIDDPSLLLALPVELLQRVTDNLSDETLTTFRLTCKTMEAATFDQFAKIFLADRYCCIYDQPRWTLLRDMVSSRLGVRIRRVILTTNVLAPARIEHLHLIPTQSEAEEEGMFDILFSQCVLGDALVKAVGARKQTAAWPSKSQIERCLTCIRDLGPNVRVTLDFDGDFAYRAEKECTSVKANLLVAIALRQQQRLAASL